MTQVFDLRLLQTHTHTTVTLGLRNFSTVLLFDSGCLSDWFQRRRCGHYCEADHTNTGLESYPCVCWDYESHF